MSEPSASNPELSLGQRLTVLAAAFLGWMFAGLQIALFVLIHRSAMTICITSLRCRRMQRRP